MHYLDWNITVPVGVCVMQNGGLNVGEQVFLTVGHSVFF